VAKTDPAEVEYLLRVHAVGPHWLSGAIIPSMRTRPRGDIVFVSSIATRHHQAGGAPYSMGKAAMESRAVTQAKEKRHPNNHGNVVAPGLIATEMGRRLVKGAGGVDDITTLDASSPWGRVCRPEDVADVVRFFVSDAAGYLTGERVYLDGLGVHP
jgi:NAD(P)-dependent dehydrogenase (short-subunit alcohol dehydrogenase family)